MGNGEVQSSRGDLLQPSHVARPTTVPPEHPCGATLPYPATPVQQQRKLRCTMLRLAVGRSGGGLLQQAAVQGSAPYGSSKLIATCGCKDSDSPSDSWNQQLQWYRGNWHTFCSCACYHSPSYGD